MNKKLLLSILPLLALSSCGGQGSSSSIPSIFSTATSEPFVTHLSISGTHKTSFYIGEAFTSEGLIVTLEEEGLSSEVTEDCDILAPDTLSLGKKEVQIVYGDFSTSYEIDVIDKTCKNYNVSLAEIYEFGAALKEVSGHVKSSHNETITGTYYLTEGTPFTMITSSVYDTTRYSDISVSKGSYGFLDDDGGVTAETRFEAQTFYDSKNFYQITDYEESDWTDSKSVISRSQNSDIESVLNIDYPNIFAPTVDVMIAAFGNEYYTCSATGLESSGEAWSFSIKLTLLEDNLKTPREVIDYKAQLTLDDEGYVSAVSTEMEDALYGGGIKANWKKTFVDSTFVQGEWEEFDGTRFNPEDYSN